MKNEKEIVRALRLILQSNEHLDLKEEEISQLEHTTNTHGWRVFQKLIFKKIAIESRKLRFNDSEKRDQFTFDRINGVIDGLEYVQKIVSETIEGYNLNQGDESHNPND